MLMQKDHAVSSKSPVENDDKMRKVLDRNLADFLKDQKIRMNLQKISDSEFWLVDPYGFLTARFLVDETALKVTYDVFSPKYDLHLRESSLKDIEQLERILEEKGKWNYAKSIEDLWLVLDYVRIWAQKRGHSIKEKRQV
jgi:hypothetical protein